jgi:hypothetical protein
MEVDMKAIIGYGKGAASSTTGVAAQTDVQSCRRRFLKRACQCLIVPAAAVVITLCVNWQVHGSSSDADAETATDYFESDNLPAIYDFLPFDFDSALQ